VPTVSESIVRISIATSDLSGRSIVPLTISENLSARREIFPLGSPGRGKEISRGERVLATVLDRLYPCAVMERLAHKAVRRSIP